MSEPERLADSPFFQELQHKFGDELNRGDTMAAEPTIDGIRKNPTTDPQTGYGRDMLNGVLVSSYEGCEFKQPWFAHKCHVHDGREEILCYVRTKDQVRIAKDMRLNLQGISYKRGQHSDYLQCFLSKNQPDNRNVPPQEEPQAAPTHPTTTNGDREYWDKVRAMERRGYTVKDAAHMLCVRSLIIDDAALLNADNVIADAKRLLHWIETGNDSPEWPADNDKPPANEDIPF